jgi:hypothetical protein
MCAIVCFLCRLVFLNAERGTFDHLAVMDFSKIFMAHMAELVHEALLLLAAIRLFDEIFFEIHDVFVWRLFGSVDIDGSEVGVFG